jgi:hypothetical protein
MNMHICATTQDVLCVEVAVQSLICNICFWSSLPLVVFSA